MTRIFTRIVLLALLSLASAPALAADSLWVEVDSGLHYAQFPVSLPSQTADSCIDILRIDPHRYSFEILMISETGGYSLTAEEWCRQYGLLAATNAGMFQQDFRTHVGYLRHHDHVNSSRRVSKYLSAAATDPIDSTLPPFRIFDLDMISLDSVKVMYRTVIQNLRLIKHPGRNTWSQQDDLWSEAALGEDKDGNILFIFSRSPYSMFDLNHILLSLPINLVAAQHLEGGPEASLFLSHNGHVIRRVGSFETRLLSSDSNNRFWPLPNVIGIKKLAPQ